MQNKRAKSLKPPSALHRLVRLRGHEDRSVTLAEAGEFNAITLANIKQYFEDLPSMGVHVFGAVRPRFDNVPGCVLLVGSRSREAAQVLLDESFLCAAGLGLSKIFGSWSCAEVGGVFISRVNSQYVQQVSPPQVDIELWPGANEVSAWLSELFPDSSSPNAPVAVFVAEAIERSVAAAISAETSDLTRHLRDVIEEQLSGRRGGNLH